MFIGPGDRLHLVDGTGFIFRAVHALRDQVAGQIACLVGAVLHAGAAAHGTWFGHVGAVGAAAGSMIRASVVLVPLARVADRSSTPPPSAAAPAATGALSKLCTGVALVIQFSIVEILGAMGDASQSYLRAGIGVILVIVVLGETLTSTIRIGLLATTAGVTPINWHGFGWTSETPEERSRFCGCRPLCKRFRLVWSRYQVWSSVRLGRVVHRSRPGGNGA